ncbi:MAG: DUF805 domain-containing protein [Propionibacteriaceae bacterium]|nr:DUF805 domain-containing protein [Propionibacteriaceae bacterium]
MSWQNYGPHDQPDRPPTGAYHPNEPSGYVTRDPFGSPGYQQASWNPLPARPQPYAPLIGGPMAAGYSRQHPPRPRVGFVQAGQLLFKNYATFHGRASLSEYWWVALWSVLAMLVAWIPGLGLIFLAAMIPMLALQVRRLHDAGYSGWWTLLNLTGIGSIVVLIFSLQPSSPAGIRYDHPDGRQPAIS